MFGYKNILLALDFRADNNQLIAKAQAVVAESSANLFLIHVQETVVSGYASTGISFNEQIVSVQASLQKEAREKIAETSKNLGVPAERAFLVEGNPADEIHRAAEENDIDLILIGTHGQKGIRLLLGSTANSVLHGVTCDVLTVRLKD